MAQESIKGWGGQRDGQGRKSTIPLGGEAKAVNLRVGTGLLDKLRERWPDLNDGDLIRAAIWEAVGEPKV